MCFPHLAELDQPHRLPPHTAQKRHPVPTTTECIRLTTDRLCRCCRRGRRILNMIHTAHLQPRITRTVLRHMHGSHHIPPATEQKASDRGLLARLLHQSHQQACTTNLERPLEVASVPCKQLQPTHQRRPIVFPVLLARLSRRSTWLPCTLLCRHRQSKRGVCLFPTRTPTPIPHTPLQRSLKSAHWALSLSLELTSMVYIAVQACRGLQILKLDLLPLVLDRSAVCQCLKLDQQTPPLGTPHLPTQAIPS